MNREVVADIAFCFDNCALTLIIKVNYQLQTTDRFQECGRLTHFNRLIELMQSLWRIVIGNIKREGHVSSSICWQFSTPQDSQSPIISFQKRFIISPKEHGLLNVPFDHFHESQYFIINFTDE
jgi:hypothetical protein